MPIDSAEILAIICILAIAYFAYTDYRNLTRENFRKTLVVGIVATALGVGCRVLATHVSTEADTSLTVGFTLLNIGVIDIFVCLLKWRTLK